MKAIDLADFFDTNIEDQEEGFKSLSKKKTEENYFGSYNEPKNFFRGFIYGLLFCLPFWIFLFWLMS